MLILTFLFNSHILSSSLTGEILNTGSLTLSAQSDINAVADVADGYSDKLPDGLDINAIRGNIGTADLSAAIALSSNESTTIQDLLNQGEDKIKAWQVDAITALDACAAVANGTVVPQAQALDAGNSNTTMSDSSMSSSSPEPQSSISPTNTPMSSMSMSSANSLATFGWTSWLMGLVMLQAGVFFM
jgi:hypothetical protein